MQHLTSGPIPVLSGNGGQMAAGFAEAVIMQQFGGADHQAKLQEVGTSHICTNLTSAEFSFLVRQQRACSNTHTLPSAHYMPICLTTCNKVSLVQSSPALLQPLVEEMCRFALLLGPAVSQIAYTWNGMGLR